MRAWSFAVVACAVALAGCGDDDGTPTPTDAGTDAGMVMATDAGGRDAGRPRPDSGPGDPCAADMASAISTVECNGPAPGPAAANAFGGLCTPDAMNPQGSCTAMTDVCEARMGVAQGICLRPCDPDPAGTYTSTSTCPMGSRCFTFSDTVAVCYPDCTMASDCASNGCDGEGSCAAPTMVIPTDGGMPTTDAGVPATDGGTPTTDAGVPATDAGVPATDAG